jgi:hypothetical protein
MKNLRIKTEKKELKNVFIPYPKDIMQCIKFWKNQTLTQCDDKGGSFNVQLYLDYLEIRYKS